MFCLADFALFKSSMLLYKITHNNDPLFLGSRRNLVASARYDPEGLILLL
jgi:hypothetical protein